MVDTNQTLSDRGCRDPPQEWCSHVPRIYLVQVILSFLLNSMGAYICYLTSATIYSKILGPFPQVNKWCKYCPIYYIRKIYLALPGTRYMENLKNVSKTTTGDRTKNMEKLVQAPISEHEHLLPFPPTNHITA